MPTVLRRKQTSHPPANLEPSRQFGINAEGSTGATPDPQQPTKPKIKTRSLVTEEQPTSSPSPAPLPEAPPKPTIFVSPKVHQLIVTLSSAAAPLSWDDFVYLMTHLGFMCHPVGGSSFRFVPASADENESINFHKPHPRSLLTKDNCKWFWARLRRNYGWDADRFAVKVRGADGVIGNAQEEVGGDVAVREV